MSSDTWLPEDKMGATQLQRCPNRAEDKRMTPQKGLLHPKHHATQVKKRETNLFKTSASLFVIAVALSGCASTGSSTSTPSASKSAPEVTAYSFSPEPPKPTTWIAETGIWAYDTGYNEVNNSNFEYGPLECQALADSYWNNLDAVDKSEYFFLSMFQGCMDASMQRRPQADQFRDYPPGGVPETDPCLIGDIGPWVVIYDGPSGPGDTTVGAPCQELAEEEVLNQLPAGSFIVESWRA